MRFKASSHEQPGELGVALDTIKTNNFDEFCEFIHMAEEQGCVVIWQTEDPDHEDALVVDKLNAMRGIE